MVLIEIILILFIILLLDPKNSVAHLRKLGFYMGKIKKIWYQIRSIGKEFNINQMEQEVENESTAGESGHKVNPELSRGNQSSNDFILKGLLDLQKNNFDFNQTENILPLLFYHDPSIRDKAFDLLMMDPAFSFRKRKLVEKKDFHPDIRHFNNSLFLHLLSELRLRNLSNLLSSIPDELFLQHYLSLAYFPGIENLDSTIVFKEGKFKLYETFRAEREKIFESVSTQVSINLRDSGPMSCFHCTNRKKDTSAPDLQINWEKFEDILNITASEKEKKTLNLSGLENLLPHCLNYLSETARFNLQTTITSTAQFHENIWSQIIRFEDLKKIVIQLFEDRNLKSEQQIRQITQNILKATTCSKQIVLRYDVSFTENESWDFLNKYIDIVQYPVISLSASLSRCNKVKSEQTIKTYADYLLSIVKHLKSRYEFRRHKIIISNPIPLCLFDNESSKYLLRNTHLNNICNLDRNDFTSHFNLNPDGTYSPCEALTKDTYRFKEYSGADNLPGNYYSTLNNLIQRPVFDICRNCPLHEEGFCQGDCFSEL